MVGANKIIAPRGIAQIPERSKQAHNFDWALISLLVLALLIRVAVIIGFPSIHHPDENFQLLEQGHRYFFGTGLVPWEFSVGTRSPVLPFALGLVFAAAEPLVGGPEGYIFVTRLLLAMSSLAGVAAVYRMGQRVSPTHAVLGGLVTATWFEFAYFAGRPLTEAIATTVLLVGLSLASVSECEFTRKRLVYIGFCLALCLMLRVHLLFGLLIAWMWVGQLHVRRWWLMGIGALIPVAMFGIADAIVWGEPFQSYFKAIEVNLFQGKASTFGTNPFDWYFRLLAQRWSYAAPLLLLLVVLRTRSLMLWVLVALCILLTHSVIPHKEYRFVFPAFACLIVVAAMASADLVQSLRRQWRWAGAVAAAGSWVAVSAALAFAPSFKFEWFKQRDMIEAEFLLANQPNLCGILLYDYQWWDTGGYAYLHRNVPFYQLSERSSANASRLASAFNAVVLERSSTPDFPKEFTVRKCVGSGKVDDVCIMMRKGDCTHSLQFAPTGAGVRRLSGQEALGLRGAR
jgi:GPI mannosyltransferase 3